MRRKWVSLERLGVPSNSQSIEEFMNAVITTTEMIYNVRGGLLPQLFLIMDIQGTLNPIIVAPQSLEETRFFFEMGYAKEVTLKTEAKIREKYPTSFLSAYLIAGHYDIYRVPPEVAEKWQAGHLTYEEAKAQIKSIDSIGFLLVEKSNPEPVMKSYEIQGTPPHAKLVFMEHGPSIVSAQSRFLLHLWGE
jgi:hypothetical protein